MLDAFTPKNVPALSQMVADLGGPTPEDLAAFWGVSVRSVFRWLADDAALRHELARVVSVCQFGSANAPTARDLPRAVRSA